MPISTRGRKKENGQPQHHLSFWSEKQMFTHRYPKQTSPYVSLARTGASQSLLAVKQAKLWFKVVGCKPGWAWESAGRFVRAQVVGPRPRHSHLVGLGQGRESAFLANSQVMLLLLFQGPTLRTTGLKEVFSILTDTLLGRHYFAFLCIFGGHLLVFSAFHCIHHCHVYFPNSVPDHTVSLLKNY